MGTIYPNIRLGDIGYVVQCNYSTYEVYVKEMKVGKVTIEEYHPNVVRYDEPYYAEKYMCFETGVGTGTVYYFGVDIFASREDAENVGVVNRKQKLHKQIAERNAMLEREAKEKMERELRQLQELKAKYENVAGSE